MDEVESVKQKTIILSSELYEELRQFCDRMQIPFLDFVEESLEGATQRHELEGLLNDKARIDEKIKSKQQEAYLKGFDRGVLVALLAAAGRLAVGQHLTPRAVEERPRYQVVEGEQLTLFK